MSVSRFMSLVGFASLLAGVAFAGYQYREVHLPAFEKLKASVTYQECIQRCKETCQANGVPLDRCRCDHCNVYRAR